MNNRPNGFGVPGILIIVFTLIVLIGAGWFIWQRVSPAKPATDVSSSQQKEDSTDSASKSADKLKTADPTSDWVAYSNAEGNFSFKHPKSWVMPDNPEACSEGLVLLAPAKDSLGKCATESGGQIQISSTAGDNRGNYLMDESYYTARTSESATVNGVTGKKVSATVIGMEDEVFVGGLPNNTKTVMYVFYTDDRTVVASYVQEPTFPDVLGDFNLLVTKTLKFSK
jgi:hypothetical protein